MESTTEAALSSKKIKLQTLQTNIPTYMNKSTAKKKSGKSVGIAECFANATAKKGNNAAFYVAMYLPRK